MKSSPGPSTIHFDAKVFDIKGDNNFIRPVDSPDGYPNALGVVHGEPPLSWAPYEKTFTISVTSLPQIEKQTD
jgi:hypothetical protein